MTVATVPAWYAGYLAGLVILLAAVGHLLDAAGRRLELWRARRRHPSAGRHLSRP